MDEPAGGLRFRPGAAEEAAGRPAPTSERPARRSDDDPPPLQPNPCAPEVSVLIFEWLWFGGWWHAV